MENLSTITPEEIKTLGLSQEEVDALDIANYLCDTADMLPEEPEEMEKYIEKNIPDDFEAGMKKLFEMAENDPENTQKILALYEVANSVKEVPPVVEKLSVDEVLKGENEEFLNSIVEKLRSSTVSE